MFVFSKCWQFFGQIWAQEHAQQPWFDKCYKNQRILPREIDSKAPRFICNSEFWILDPGPGPKPPKSGPGWQSLWRQGLGR
jgi:hypothetical protein